MEYHKFSTEDFIQDEFFIEWVNNPNPSNIKFWQNWVAQHPEKRDELLEAKTFIEQLREASAEPVLSAPRSEALWAGVERQIEGQSKTRPLSRKKKTAAPHLFWKLGIAASLLLIASIAFSIWYNTFPAEIRYRTSYGEIKEILLPDSSMVYLNANSELIVKGDWDTQPGREVNLKGEAYFMVTKQAVPEGERKFTVHTPDFNVVVLGTRFNVIHRKNRKRVVLEEGKIDLQLNNESKAPAQNAHYPAQKSIAVKPGERAEFNEKTLEEPLHIEKVNTRVHSSWKSQQLVFDNTPFEELTSILEDNYGYQVTVRDPELLDKKLSGTVASNNIGTLLKSLELIFGIEISRENKKQLVFSKAPQTD